MILIAKTIGACLFGLLAALAIVANWTIVVRSAASRSYSASLVPVVGGAAGTVALILWPHHDLAGYWWIPLALDWGSGLGLVAAPFFYLRYRRRKMRDEAGG